MMIATPPNHTRKWNRWVTYALVPLALTVFPQLKSVVISSMQPQLAFVITEVHGHQKQASGPLGQFVLQTGLGKATVNRNEFKSHPPHSQICVGRMQSQNLLVVELAECERGNHPSEVPQQPHLDD